MTASLSSVFQKHIFKMSHSPRKRQRLSRTALTGGSSSFIARFSSNSRPLVVIFHFSSPHPTANKLAVFAGSPGCVYASDGEQTTRGPSLADCRFVFCRDLFFWFRVFVAVVFHFDGSGGSGSGSGGNSNSNSRCMKKWRTQAEFQRETGSV